MIWCNKDKYNFISKLLKTNHNKEVQYLKTLAEREDLDEEVKLLVDRFFSLNNNFDLRDFVKQQTFFKFEFHDDLLGKDFAENKDSVAYAIIETILSKKH
jgi:hypothetical protein